jgi:hypothetical protein
MGRSVMTPIGLIVIAVERTPDFGGLWGHFCRRRKEIASPIYASFLYHIIFPDPDTKGY